MLVKLRWVLRPFIELLSLSLFLLLLLFCLLHVVLAEFHKSLELTVSLQHSDTFDHAVLLTLLAFGR